MDMRKDALGKAKKAFAEDRERICIAMQVILEAVKYACKNGSMALSKDEHVRNGQPYVLDVIEEKEHTAIPLKKRLAFGLECALLGSGIEDTEKLLENKYFVSAFAGLDAVIAYVYWVGVRGIMRKSSYLSVLEFFMSLAQDAEEDAFENYAKKLSAGYSELLWGPLPFEPKKKIQFL